MQRMRFLLTIIFLISCSQQQVVDYEPFDIYCMPYFKVPGISAEQNSSKRIIIRDLPEKKNHTYTSELGDTIISKREVIAEDFVYINISPSKDIIFRSSTSIPRDLINFLQEDEKKRATVTSMGSSCFPYLVNISAYKASDLELANKIINLVQDGYSPSYITLNRLNLNKGVKSTLVTTPQYDLYSFPEGISVESKSKFTSSDSQWERFSESIMSILVLKNREEIFLIPKAASYRNSYAIPIKGKVNVLRNDTEFTPNARSDTFFDQNLIYNGRSGNTIKFLYREFYGNTNRSPFQQEVTYDLNIGEIIGFKGARFKIIDANNIELKYQVIDSF